MTKKLNPEVIAAKKILRKWLQRRFKVLASGNSDPQMPNYIPIAKMRTLAFKEVPMAGCECFNWVNEFEAGRIRREVDGRYETKSLIFVIDFCPFCGSKLTEEAGDAE